MPRRKVRSLQPAIGGFDFVDSRRTSIADQAEKGTPVTKDRLLTVHWNNMLALGLGIPTLIYVVTAFSTALWLERGGLIGLAVFGALF